MTPLPLSHSYDARSGGPYSGRRWSDAREGFGFGQRADFEVSRPSSVKEEVSAALVISSVRRLEAGVYR